MQKKPAPKKKGIAIEIKVGKPGAKGMPPVPPLPTPQQVPPRPPAKKQPMPMMTQKPNPFIQVPKKTAKRGK